MRFYIAGPVYGLLPEQAKENFQDMELRLRALFPNILHKHIFNPYAYFNDFTRPGSDFLWERPFTEEGVKNASWEDFMDICMYIVFRGEFSHIVMLDGWKQSKGAGIEFVVAKQLKAKEVFERNIRAFGQNAFICKEQIITPINHKRNGQKI